jgi:uncharacterized protein YfaP (DUF2135 family)
LSGSSQTFNWSANGATVREWGIYVGSSLLIRYIHDSGTLGTSLSTTVNSLPTDGSTLFVRLWYRTSTGWQSVDVQYNAASGSGFDVTKNLFIDDDNTGSCNGVTIAVVDLNSGANNLTVDLAFNGDLDLNVAEPDGTCVWWQESSSINGGSHSGDITAGGGAETYTITNGPAGVYTIRAHYHGSAQNGVFHINGSNGSLNFAAKTGEVPDVFIFDENK